jgi:DNA polymerase-3 subunit alpha
MQIANLVAGYSFGEGEILRRAVSKMERAVMQEEGPKFIARAEQRGYSQTVAKKIFDLILRFADYGFNRSHAASYAIISYQMAYLKANYPQYFMASVLRTEMGSARGTATAIKEARSLGIAILPQSVNVSFRGHRAISGTIRLGLGLIKSIGFEIANKLLLEREQNPFKDFYDFVARTSEFLGDKVLTNLIDAGACDDFGYNRATLHKNVKRILEHRQFGPLVAVEFVMEEADTKADSNTLMEQEYELFGFYLQTHPIQLFDDQIKQNGWVTPSEIDPAGRQRVNCIGYVTRIKEIKDKNGQPMAFIELTDEATQVDMTIFAREFSDEYRNLINKVVVVNGSVNVRNDRLGINFTQVVTILSS